MVVLGCWTEEVVGRVGCHVGAKLDLRYSLCVGVICFEKPCMLKLI